MSGYGQIDPRRPPLSGSDRAPPGGVPRAGDTRTRTRLWVGAGAAAGAADRHTRRRDGLGGTDMRSSHLLMSPLPTWRILSSTIPTRPRGHQSSVHVNNAVNIALSQDSYFCPLIGGGQSTCGYCPRWTVHGGQWTVHQVVDSLRRTVRRTVLFCAHTPHTILFEPNLLSDFASEPHFGSMIPMLIQLR